MNFATPYRDGSEPITMNFASPYSLGSEPTTMNLPTPATSIDSQRLTEVNKYWNARIKDALPSKEQQLFSNAMGTLTGAYLKALTIEKASSISDKMKERLVTDVRIELHKFGERLLRSMQDFNKNQTHLESNLDNFERKINQDLNHSKLFEPFRDFDFSKSKSVETVVSKLVDIEVTRFSFDIREGILDPKNRVVTSESAHPQSLGAFEEEIKQEIQKRNDLTVEEIYRRRRQDGGPSLPYYLPSSDD